MSISNICGVTMNTVYCKQYSYLWFTFGRRGGIILFHKLVDLLASVYQLFGGKSLSLNLASSLLTIC